ncbi:hypothetical protein HYPSUDRAFT_209793 [Hypholoma sublateritium FD-334 SS-4]|uniref:Uncharacterized protein n=1 Tax=Hypholoma sublateritium (strain FD-334 SS-4) TaxID=945553 RepID=A0A0D2LQQ5_HYPSF|nr:hypothetical protein HYPSUDRAFT_209793 [Hypholoma sublateritium FD-334 SS-4]
MVLRPPITFALLSRALSTTIMTTTRPSAAAKGKGKARALSPRDLTERTEAARASAERAAASERIAAARAPAARDSTPYQESTASRSALTRITNGTQLETVVLAARAVDGVQPTVTRRRITDVTEVLHGAEAAAAMVAISAANMPDADPNAMQISRPSSPDPPASLTDVAELARFDRFNAVRQLILATRDIIDKKVAFESADEELAANLQAAEIAVANQMENRATTSRATYDASPNPGTPMEITPGPAPIPRYATPATPSPRSAAGSGFMLRQSAAQRAAVGLHTGPYNSRGQLPPAYSAEGRAERPFSTLTRGRTAALGASNIPAYFSRSAVEGGQGSTSSAGSAATSHRNAEAGPSRPPAYALNEAGMSYFTMPVRPSPRNGFAEHEVIRTSTEIVNGTPCITIFDSDADTEEADEERSEN